MVPAFDKSPTVWCLTAMPKACSRVIVCSSGGFAIEFYRMLRSLSDPNWAIHGSVWQQGSRPPLREEDSLTVMDIPVVTNSNLRISVY